jgi:hypothetical protein
MGLLFFLCMEGSFDAAEMIKEPRTEAAEE